MQIGFLESFKTLFLQHLFAKISKSKAFAPLWPHGNLTPIIYTSIVLFQMNPCTPQICMFFLFFASIRVVAKKSTLLFILQI
jgi:hypothetical protein